MPKLSVITINFNNKDGLLKTIESVRSQTWRDFEHLIIDGGSKDGSLDLILKFQDGFSFWVSEKDKGIYDAQNKGILNSKSEYCLFLNSGDFLVNSSVFEKVFEASPDSDIIYGDMLVDHGNGRIDYGRSPAQLTLPFLAYGVLWHCATMIRRSLFDTYGLYDLSYKIIADIDFFLKAIGVGNASFTYVPVAISQFNTEGFGSNPNNAPLLEEERVRSRKQHLSPLTISLIERFIKMENDLFVFSLLRLPQLMNIFRNIKWVRAIGLYFLRLIRSFGLID
ncbi:glycosyltransferase family 2 protein [Leptospira ilyithenensis]|uniref:Glycosyltransferase n=1 Tax=Leptospira ilyithenensis TaxID=2484901 RepID=A0A4R9LPZ3_9LEPT|nr:glycosyltransferase family 2 protein [Leptospira ilyithenensis]TGN08040.1 glycosyltransferase [Leptospira ilyithenensis]